MTGNDALVDSIVQRFPRFLDRRELAPRIADAMRTIDRARFLPPDMIDSAYLDAPVAIGYGQTCSQPSMVAFFMDVLDLQPGCRVLEVGAGSGYAAAIAATLCAPDGIVYAAEIIPELAVCARANCARYSDRLVVLERDASDGLPEMAPFDRIFLSAGVASSAFSPDILTDQLVENGVLVYPESRGALYRLKKKCGRVFREEWFGVSFVQLRGRNA